MFATALGVLGPRVLQSDTQSIVDRLTQYMRADDEARFQATLKRGLALHPGEPAIALLGAAYAGSKRHPDAPRWLSIVMIEAPEWAAPHAIAARWLVAEGKIDQALIEIREAEERRAGSAREVLCEVLVSSPNMDYLERAAPTGGQRIAFLNRTATSCGRLPVAFYEEIDAAILVDDPTHPAATLRATRRLVAGGRSEDAIALLERSARIHPNTASLWVALIQAHLQVGDVNAAQLALEEASSNDLDDVAMSEAKARVEAGRGNTDEMRATITRLRGQSAGDLRKVAASFMLEGELEAALGNVDEALAAYAAADAASPETSALQRAAELALRSGRSSHARRVYGTLCSRNPGGPACAQEERLAKELREATPRPALP
ncbi:MAG: hypothetical protein AMJ62_12135 [Myxococcales bacterium SG8_38]|nr:MAG: hypothetical protein AMJ62_12135 [Myxococcales bacterium SG8_38]